MLTSDEIFFVSSVSLLEKALLTFCSSVSSSCPFLPSHTTSLLSRRSKRHLGTPVKMPQTSSPLGVEVVARYFCYKSYICFAVADTIDHHLYRPDQCYILAQVVQRLDNTIHRINHYPADSVVCFVNIYPLDSDLSGG